MTAHQLDSAFMFPISPCPRLRKIGEIGDAPTSKRSTFLLASPGRDFLSPLRQFFQPADREGGPGIDETDRHGDTTRPGPRSLFPAPRGKSGQRLRCARANLEDRTFCREVDRAPITGRA